MTGTLTLHRAGPGVTVQDLGRPGMTAQGLSQGGAADRLALHEAAALLGLRTPVPALEMAMTGAEVSVDTPTRVALTGARMQAMLNGQPVAWNATHLLHPWDRLTIGAARAGIYGYLTPAGGIATAAVMGGHGAHLTAGIGTALGPETVLPLGRDPDPAARQTVIRTDDRLSGGTLRMMPGPQTGLFDDATRARFHATHFTRSRTGNRQGVRLDFDGDPFSSGTDSLASDIIRAGDVQMTGEGVPYILLSECQTMGGYPRIGTVLPQDLPRVAQAAPGTEFAFREMTVAEADALWQPDQDVLKSLKAKVQPLRRDPHDIPDLLSYQLIGGVIRGDETED
ncbi:urea amidolyase, homolog [Pseudooceanicola batsensis HTCC2597]|uniref:Urea amidolyase, homolog n=1 Tax=Pseudooceanicola batsensis (strain ATCC BAA-863 / DSM 15984 / KCTC 12145 / HTCC2597) TaxID=252305 RepID=A3TUY8_PSEBH|nr:biotin-dependent carboxyltransferase family protein [Pseudooceanicola batsensis]EAQ04334.1 urea amidolyase, homolog [Pseudooceanicola batsensis HTCC2597]